MSVLTLIREKMAQNKVDALLVTNHLNRRYLTNFTGSAGVVIITENKAIIMTDFRYENQVHEQTEGFEIIIYKQSDAMLVNVIQEVNRLNIRSLGFESDDLNFDTFTLLNEKCSANLVPINSVFGDIRAIKTPDEIENFKIASNITDRAFAEICDFIKAGMSELEVANNLEFILKREGSDFDGRQMTVASGFRSALPHGRPSDKVIETGDMIMLDFGSVYKGYHSDMTRTIAVGEPADELKEVHQIVLDALTLTKEKIQVGMAGKEVDAISRDYIREKGYGEKFGHGSGHGLGLAIHENPFFSPSSNHIVQENMVITIEPGIYIPNLGGVRIEDNLIIKTDTHEVLTKSSRELKII